MFRRKLEALDYPMLEDFTTFSADINDVNLRNLIVWLEDQKIRHYAIEERDELRNINSEQWPAVFKEYLRNVGATIESDNMAELVEWLLGMAIRLEYADNTEALSKVSSNHINSNGGTSESKAGGPFDHIDFHSSDFIAGVNALASKLEISQHPNHLKTLEAIVGLVKSRYSKQIVENPLQFQPKGKPFPLLDFDMGFSDGDYVMNQAAKVLRILYIEDLRQLQTKINECIVACQTITADPQVETKMIRAGQFLAGMQRSHR